MKSRVRVILSGHDSVVSLAVYSPDERRILTAGWEAQTDKELFT